MLFACRPSGRKQKEIRSDMGCFLSAPCRKSLDRSPASSRIRIHAGCGLFFGKFIYFRNNFNFPVNMAIK